MSTFDYDHWKLRSPYEDEPELPDPDEYDYPKEFPSTARVRFSDTGWGHYWWLLEDEDGNTIASGYTDTIDAAVDKIMRAV